MGCLWIEAADRLFLPTEVLRTKVLRLKVLKKVTVFQPTNVTPHQDAV
jgi:hypothetical protein